MCKLSEQSRELPCLTWLTPCRPLSLKVVFMLSLFTTYIKSIHGNNSWYFSEITIMKCCSPRLQTIHTSPKYTYSSLYGSREKLQSWLLIIYTQQTCEVIMHLLKFANINFTTVLLWKIDHVSRVVRSLISLRNSPESMLQSLLTIGSLFWSWKDFWKF